LTGLQTYFRGERGHRRGYLPLAAAVCVLLISLLALIQVTHVHPVDADASHCPLCILLHSAAPVTPTAAVVVLVPYSITAPVYRPRPVVRYWHPKLFTRPPPDGC
jgi:hypothetical protein